MMRMRQVKRRIGHLLLAALLLPAAAALAAPSAEAIMAKVRVFQTSQRQELDGRIRHGGDRVPFHLSIDGGDIRYQLQDPPQTLSVRLSENGSTASGADFTDPIRGTDVTLEDIAMPFLYWKKLEFDGERTVFGGRPSWQIKAYAPSRKTSSYGMVMVWVEKDSGALLRVDAYGWDGKAAKRFEVRGIQHSGDGWLLKQMRIQKLNGTRSRDKSPTYLEIEKPE